MKVLGLVGLMVSGVFVGCASTGAGRAASLETERGAMVVPGTAVRAVVAGPRVIHAFASHAGGGLFTVPASDHADLDCTAALRGDARRVVAMARDQRVVFTVGAGEIACLATSGKRDFELLWHATNEPAPEPRSAQVAMARTAPWGVPR